jgi:hypothetical protein
LLEPLPGWRLDHSARSASDEACGTLAPHGRGDCRRTRPSEEGLMARTVSVQWIKGMKAEATIGPHRVVLDAPAEAGGGDEGPSPAEMLLGAIGA